jgi:phenylalanyl-tRNA synthetase beta chain
VAHIIVLLAGGAIDGAPVDLAYTRPNRKTINLRTLRVAKLLGEPVPAEEIDALLGSIGFEIDRKGENFVVTVPSWRLDVAAEVDLIEEVARLRGYDSFPTEIRPFRPGNVGDDPQWVASKRLRELLVGMGMLEVRPMPFVSGGEGFARVGNPLAENEAFLRREVLDTMHRDIRIFEIGSVFTPRTKALPAEDLRIALLVMGRRQPAHFTDPKSPDFDAWARYGEWDAKGLAELIAAEAYPSATVTTRPSETDGALWDVFADDRVIGAVRRVALDAPIWAAPAFGVELSLGVIDSADVAPRGESAYRPFPRSVPSVTRYQSVPSTPASELDLALLVPNEVSAEQIEASIRKTAGRLLEKLELFDRYVGQGVESGHRSLAWRLTFRHAERTLRDKEIESRRSEILKALADELNVRQRSA